MADSTFDFMMKHFVDPADGELWFKVRATGEVVDAKKQLYAEAFAIYGLSTYGRVFVEAQATEHALTVFRSIDARAHDAAHGGYDQSHDPGWLAPGAAKGTNTHIHLMEALTALFAATENPEVGERLGELVDVVWRCLLQPTGYVHLEFARDWRPCGDPIVSYGHDLETVWLLLEAAHVLGRDQEPAVRDAARAMGVHASTHGLDAHAGGYFLDGIPDGLVREQEKVWWVQFEALAGLWWVFVLTRDPCHLDRLERTLGFIEAQWDAPHGEWVWGTMPDGSVGPRGVHKGEEWKTAYHNLRALVLTADWMKAALARSFA